MLNWASKALIVKKFCLPVTQVRNGVGKLRYHTPPVLPTGCLPLLTVLLSNNPLVIKNRTGNSILLVQLVTGTKLGTTLTGSTTQRTTFNISYPPPFLIPELNRERTSDPIPSKGARSTPPPIPTPYPFPSTDPDNYLLYSVRE